MDRNKTELKHSDYGLVWKGKKLFFLLSSKEILISSHKQQSPRRLCVHYHHGDQLRDPLCSGQRGSFAKAHFGDQRFTHVNMLYTVCETSQICLWVWILYIVSYKFRLSKNIWKQSETRRVRSPWGPIGQKTTPIQTQEEAYRKQPSAHVPPLSSTVPKAEEDSGNANTLVL